MRNAEDDLIRRRLHNQQLARFRFRTPADIVGWLGAVQAQDYPRARWALGLRAAGLTDAAVEQAFDEGSILRTHILRPTWHFVTPADIRWMQALAAPRVNTASAFMYRTLSLDEKTFTRSRAVFERALGRGTPLLRQELAAALQRAGIPAVGQRLAYIVMRAELDAVICSGPRRGRQFTYALVDERAPRAKTLPREEALAELTRRYFSSHGPATIRDYVWWSGLTVREAKAGIAVLDPALKQEVIGEREYWRVPSRSSPARQPSPYAYLLPNYDEYLIAYKDRDPVVGARAWNAVAERSDMFAHLLIVDGRLAGTWRRSVKAGVVVVAVVPYRRPTPAVGRAIADAAERLGRFMTLPVVLSEIGGS